MSAPPIDTEWGRIPDFRVLYPYAPCRCFEAHAGMTPRMAYLLWAECSSFGDYFRQDAESLEDDGSLIWDDMLPPAARRALTPSWLERFARCFDDLAERIATGDGATEGALTYCTGDEPCSRRVWQFVWRGVEIVRRRSAPPRTKLAC